MNICPHCGAKLRDNARFCPACMTSLVNKQVIPTPKYNLQRWLSVTVAVFVLLAAVGAVRMMPSRPGDIPITAVMDTTTAGTSSATTAEIATATSAESITETGTNAEGTTLTTLAESFTADPLYTTRTPWIYTTTTTGTTGRVPPFLLSTTRTTSRTTTTQKSTTTKKTTAAPTTTTTTRPYWLDVTPAAVTEDGLPIEEVKWTYEPITGTSIWLSRCQRYDRPNSTDYATFRSATPSGVPVNQCIKVTGCIGTTSNGIYRVPAIIDGKTVAAVDFGDSFANAATARTVKRIYLPPDLIYLDSGLETCTKLEGLYVTSPDCWFTPEQLPDCGYYLWGGVTMYNLTIYVPPKFNPIYISDYGPKVWLYACKGNTYDAEADHLSDKECQTLYGGGDV